MHLLVKRAVCVCVFVCVHLQCMSVGGRALCVDLQPFLRGGCNFVRTAVWLWQSSNIANAHTQTHTHTQQGMLV
jgi:hypothetical protein